MRLLIVPIAAILMTFSTGCSHTPAAPSVCPAPNRPSPAAKQVLRDCCTEKPPGAAKSRPRPGTEPLWDWLAGLVVTNDQLAACHRGR